MTMPALARHQACTLATRQVEVFAQRQAHQQAYSHTHCWQRSPAFNRHTTSKNHGENVSHCQRQQC